MLSQAPGKWFLGEERHSLKTALERPSGRFTVDFRIRESESPRVLKEPAVEAVGDMDRPSGNTHKCMPSCTHIFTHVHTHACSHTGTHVHTHSHAQSYTC